jgi:hypothetical protein
MHGFDVLNEALRWQQEHNGDQTTVRGLLNDALVGVPTLAVVHHHEDDGERGAILIRRAPALAEYGIGTAIMHAIRTFACPASGGRAAAAVYIATAPAEVLPTCAAEVWAVWPVQMHRDHLDAEVLIMGHGFYDPELENPWFNVDVGLLGEMGVFPSTLEGVYDLLTCTALAVVHITHLAILARNELKGP